MSTTTLLMYIRQSHALRSVDIDPSAAPSFVGRSAHMFAHLLCKLKNIATPGCIRCG